ncbi:MAG TPA: hypothetical protein VFP28_02560 [Gemmatimonadales bacterium]|nr:hypothetical protein [Gemmatimonadales bacterium]
MTTELTYDEGTLGKVYGALLRAGLNQSQAIDAVNYMQNEGVLFREVAR